VTALISILLPLESPLSDTNPGASIIALLLEQNCQPHGRLGLHSGCLLHHISLAILKENGREEAN
jgi:hypothetical protein